MSEAHKDGGRAFPCDQIIERDANGHLHGKEVASGGMSLRDYFAAHAPEEPQPWFQPVMLSECPASVFMNESRTYTYINASAAERACGDCFININEKEQEAWKAERSKQRYVQWPGAWADEQIKARKS